MNRLRAIHKRGLPVLVALLLMSIALVGLLSVSAGAEDGISYYEIGEVVRSSSKDDPPISVEGRQLPEGAVWVKVLDGDGNHVRSCLDYHCHATSECTWTSVGSFGWWSCDETEHTSCDESCPFMYDWRVELISEDESEESCNHSYTWIDAQDPTCESDGCIGHYECSECLGYFDSGLEEIDSETVILSARGHSYGDWDTVNSPTNTTEGKIQRICANDANHVDEYDLPVLNADNYPDYVDHELCEVDGFREYFFEKDGITFIFEVSIPAGHAYGAWIEDSAATCEENGWLAHYECSRCNKYFDENHEEVAEEDIKISATGHSYGEWSEETAPTETEEGCLKRYCGDCGTEDVKTLDALDVQNAEYDSIIHNVNNCENGGTVVFSITVDEQVFQFELTFEPADHSYEVTSTIDPTCTEAGYTRYTCSVCGNSYDDVVAARHTEVDDAAVAPTCTATGLTAGKHCSECNETLVAQTIVDALGHTEVVDEAVAPTCTEAGLTEGSHCSVCEAILVEQTVISAGHTVVVDEAVDPTCTEAGLTEGSHCSVCNETLVAQTVIPASHTVVDDAAVAPTCTTDGKTAGKHCSVCNEVLVEQTVIPAGHTAVVDEAVAPTCTDTGLTEGSHCSVCGEVLTPQMVAPALGHDYSVWMLVISPTETTTGLLKKICAHDPTHEADVSKVLPVLSVENYPSYEDSVTCEEGGIREYLFEWGNTPYLFEAPLEAPGHTEAVDAAVAPTCTEKGLTEGSHCSVCGEILEAQNDVPALGHSYGEWTQTQASTCTEKGTARRDCKNCDHYETKEVDTLAHTEVDDAAVAPTCTVAGKTAGKHCSVCNETLVAQTTVEALGHTEVVDDAVAPTCTETGLTEGKHCSVCNETLVAQTTVDALGHDVVVDVAVPHTCTENGLLEGSHCSRCNVVLKAQEIDVARHDYDIVEHTDETGTHICKKCSACGVYNEENKFTFGSVEGDDLKDEDVVTDDLKDAKFDTVEKIETELFDKITEELKNNSVIGEEFLSTKIYDVTLEYYDEATGKNVVADREHFPEDGMITLSMEIDRVDLDYINIYVAHMFTMNNLYGKNAGDVEIFTVEKGNLVITESGDKLILTFTVTGLSPIMIGYGCSEHVDENKDHLCDRDGCDGSVGVHSDANLDHNCDYGCTETIGECVDSASNRDHVCDYGCGRVFDKCKDTDKDHLCNVCNAMISDCVDNNKDHKCDNGCKRYFGVLSDQDRNHVCDYCGKESLGDHADLDKDHACDYGCGVALSSCGDADNNHKCDVCGSSLSDCRDEDSDGVCDMCGYEEEKDDTLKTILVVVLIVALLIACERLVHLIKKQRVKKTFFAKVEAPAVKAETPSAEVVATSEEAADSEETPESTTETE